MTKNHKNMIKTLLSFIKIARLDKPIGTMLLLWPVLWAIWLSTAGNPHSKLLLIFVLGTCIMRSAGCVINDFADQKFDGQVKRTQNRPFPAGDISTSQAITLFFILIAIAFLLVLQTNELTIFLSVPAVILATTYPYSKRISYLPQLHLGVTFAWAIPMVFAAHLSTVSNIAWLVFLTTITWALIYDTQYAMVDKDDDVKIGVKSTAILFGDSDRHIVTFLQALMILGLILIGYSAELSWYFALAIGLTSLVFVYQNALLKQLSRVGYFKAFRTNTWIGLIVFLGIDLSYRLN